MELEEVLVEELVCLLEFDGPVDGIQCVGSLWLSMQDCWQGGGESSIPGDQWHSSEYKLLHVKSAKGV